MNLTSDRLAGSLESNLGAANVSSDLETRSRYSIDGRPPGLVCFPGDPAELAITLKIAAEAAATVLPWSGGTAMAIGNLTSEIDLVVGVHRLDRLVEHDAANLTVTLQSGMTLAAAQAFLASRGQFLAFDPPYAERATIGGTVAANLNGLRRSCYGSVRDLVIGMRVALITGEQIKAGGKVVKNVAGYDLCKLFIGSLGTLGILSEVTLRVSPLPEDTATLVASGSLPQVLQVAENLRDSSLLPAASAAFNTIVDSAPGPWNVAVCCEGFSEAVERHLRDAGIMAASNGLQYRVCRNHIHRKLWSELADAPLQPNRTSFRLTIPPASSFRALDVIERMTEHASSVHLVSDGYTGTIWISFDAAADAFAWFLKLSSLAKEEHGHVVMLAGPAKVKQEVDVWGPAPPTLSLMREIKRQFDPGNLLSPGRFLARI